MFVQVWELCFQVNITVFQFSLIRLYEVSNMCEVFCPQRLETETISALIHRLVVKEKTGKNESLV